MARGAARHRGLRLGDALAALARDEPIAVEPTDDGDRVSIAGLDVTDVIRDPEVAARVSEVSAHPGVREQMVAAQRAVMASGSWVSDGRDVGSAVVPDAELKVFLTALLEERARRRHADLDHQGVTMELDRVLEDVRRRDHIDSTRAASPLRVADGAIVIDSSELDADEVADLIVRLVEDLRESEEARDEVLDHLSHRAPVVTRFWWVLGHLTLLPIAYVFFRLSVSGREHIPPDGPVLIVCNHISQADPAILGAAAVPRKSYYFTAKAELFRVPFLRGYVNRMGAFPVERGGADRLGAAAVPRSARERRRADDVPGGEALHRRAPATRAVRRGLAGADPRGHRDPRRRSGQATASGTRPVWPSGRRWTCRRFTASRAPRARVRRLTG